MGRFLMGMNSIGIIPGHVLNLHPAPLLPAMYRYFHACLIPGIFPLTSLEWPSNKHPTAAASQPTASCQSLESAESVSLASHSLNSPARPLEQLQSSLKVVALSINASFSLPLIPTKSSSLIQSLPLPFTLPAFIGLQNPSQL